VDNGRIATQELYGAVIVTGLGGLNAAQPKHVKAPHADVDGCWSRCERSRWILWQRTLTTSVNGHAKVVQVLMNAGAEVNAQGADCSIILQAASVHGHAGVVQILMDAGADANAQDGEYGNAPAAASRGGYERVVQMLIGAGAVSREDSIGDGKALVSDRLTIQA
jgi:hypothetical protein